MSNIQKKIKFESQFGADRSRILLEKPEGPDYFNYLNDDCLSKIFKYLSIKQRLDVVLVCKRWKHASQFAWDDVKTLNFHNPSLPWKGDSSELPITYRTKNCTARILQNCGSSLRELELGEHVNDKIMGVLMRHCCNLTKLEADISNDGFVSPNFLSLMPHLSYVKIQGRKNAFDDDIVDSLPAKILTELHFTVDIAHLFSGPRLPTPKGSYGLERFKKLTAITLDGFWLESEFLELISKKNQLTYLSLANCAPVEDIDLSCLTLLINLEHLDLSFLELVDDVFVKLISKNLKKLRYLNLRRCEQVYDDGIKSLADLPQLEDLDLAFNEHVTDDSLRKLRHLKRLNLGNCSEVYDSGLIELLEFAHNLEYLNVTNTEVTENFLQVAGRIIESRANNIPVKILVHDHLFDTWKSCAASFPLLIVDESDEGFYYKPIDGLTNNGDDGFEIDDDECSSDPECSSDVS